MDTEKQDITSTNREIIAGALQSRESRFNHLKSTRFDPEALWNRVDGDMELLRELVVVFAEEGPRMLARIEDAIRHGSASDLEKSSHKIKGSVLQFSAHGASGIALQLEEMGRSGSMTGAESLLRSLKREIDLLRADLNAMVCGGPAV